MKILFYRYGSICEPDILDAFSALQIEVIEEKSEIMRKNIPTEERIRTLSTLLLTHNPFFVFSINFFPIISDICEKLHVLYVSLSVDCPVLELFDESIKNTCNRIFLFDRSQYDTVHSYNPNCIFHMPLAVNTQRYDTVIKPAQYPPAFQYDVSFVGSLYQEKSPLQTLSLENYEKGYIEGLLMAQSCFPYTMLMQEGLSDSLVETIRLADSTFYHPDHPVENTDAYVVLHYYLAAEFSHRNRVQTLNALAESHQVHLFTRSDTSALPNVHCHGGVSTHQEMPLVFYNSKINLNMTILSIQTGLPQRIWDVLGCGGFLLTNYQSEIPDHFIPEKHLECFESISECDEKISYYLTHEDERREIAKNGYELVKKEHTYLRRIIQMLKIIESSIGISPNV